MPAQPRGGPPFQRGSQIPSSQILHWESAHGIQYSFLWACFFTDTRTGTHHTITTSYVLFYNRYPSNMNILSSTTESLLGLSPHRAQPIGSLSGLIWASISDSLGLDAHPYHEEQDHLRSRHKRYGTCIHGEYVFLWIFQSMTKFESISYAGMWILVDYSRHALW